MPLRFKIAAVAYGMMLMICYDNLWRPFEDITDAFVGLASLLILSIVALWPNPERADRVDRQIDGSSWADRIDIESRGPKR